MTKISQPNITLQAEINPKVKFWMSLIGAALLIILLSMLVVDHLYNPNNFNISKITLSGDAPHVDRDELKKSAIELIEGNYFSLNLQKLITALNTLPWVEQIRLRRQWPNTLSIHIEEHQPIALWGESRWLTTTGKLVSLPLPKNVILPQLNGPNNSIDLVWPKYRKWSDIFSRHGLQLASIDLNKQHLYTLTLAYSVVQKGGTKDFRMVLLESNADQQIDTFLTSYQQGLIGDTQQIKTVDLRYPSGFSISRYEPDKLAQVVN